MNTKTLKIYSTNDISWQIHFQIGNNFENVVCCYTVIDSERGLNLAYRHGQSNIKNYDYESVPRRILIKSIMNGIKYENLKDKLKAYEKEKTWSLVS